MTGPESSKVVCTFCISFPMIAGNDSLIDEKKRLTLSLIAYPDV